MSIAWFSSTPEMDVTFSREAEVQSWLDFEAALARVQAALGLIPEAAAGDITARAKVDHFDLDRLRDDIASAVHPIVPLVRVLADAFEGDNGKHVHWGATTQDVLDTGLVLRLKRADATIRADLEMLTSELRHLAVRHRDTAMAGRTHGQHAVPITLGYTLAVFVDELRRHLTSLAAVQAETMVVQFGGATGTLASIGPVGLDVLRGLARELKLGEPAISWHVARDRLAHHTFLLALVASTLQRLGAATFLLQRNEIGELPEPFHGGKVGSSTMPHKRNLAMSEALWTLGEVVKNDVRTALSSLGSLNERDKSVFSVEVDYVRESVGTSTAWSCSRPASSGG